MTSEDCLIECLSNKSGFCMHLLSVARGSEGALKWVWAEPGHQMDFGVHRVKNAATIWLIFHDFPGLENLNFKFHHCMHHVLSVSYISSENCYIYAVYHFQLQKNPPPFIIGCVVYFLLLTTIALVTSGKHVTSICHYPISICLC